MSGQLVMALVDEPLVGVRAGDCGQMCLSRVRMAMDDDERPPATCITVLWERPEPNGNPRYTTMLCEQVSVVARIGAIRLPMAGGTYMQAHVYVR